MRRGEAAVPLIGVADGIAREERAGLTFMFVARSVAIAILCGWALTLPLARSGYYLLALAAFAVLGAVPYLMTRHGLRGAVPVTAAFLLLDTILLSYILIVPTPYTVEGWTPQLNLRLWNFLYLGIFLVSMALSYSPRLVMLTGISSVIAWSLGYLWVASLPDSLARSSTEALSRGHGPEAVIREFLGPNTVSLTTLGYQIAFLALVTIILTLTVWRSRQLVHRQVAAESERAALSRYFSPNIVRELSRGSGALTRPVVQPAAVMFVDMVGFTAITENLPPDRLVGLLSEFHGRLVRIAFAHDGTLDKYIGDAIMVNFGTPRPRADDPVRALTCAAAMIAEVGRWNAERRAAGETPIRIGIGIHYGEVVVGNIGDADRLEYTVLGDTVNVASRLERLTREIGTSLVVSDDVVLAARRCGFEPADLIPGLYRDRSHSVRGRREPVTIWCLGENAGAAH